MLMIVVISCVSVAPLIRRCLGRSSLEYVGQAPGSRRQRNSLVLHPLPCRAIVPSLPCVLPGVRATSKLPILFA
eukprot:5905247-Pyramimonas_sp.AAC.1